MDKLSFIARMGSMAPNSHNAQMWKVGIDSVHNRLMIGLDTTHLLTQVDPLNREAWISCGAFAQNALMSALDVHYQGRLELEDDGILLSFAPATGDISHDYASLIRQRHSNRFPFHKRKICNADIDTILQLSSDISYAARGTLLYDSIVNLSRLADIQQMNNQNKLTELGQWMRFSNKEAQKYPDGLSTDELAITGFNKLFFHLFINRKRFISNHFIRKQSINQTNNLYDQCGGYIIITSKGQSQKEWIEAGVLLEKVWLYCVAHYISVHPMSQVIEEEPFNNRLGNLLKLNRPVQMILRVGYSDVCQSNKTKRRREVVNISR